MARGFENLGSREDVVEALRELADVAPGVRKAVIKINEGFAGAGNAVFTYPDDTRDRTDAARIDEALEDLAWTSAGESPNAFFSKLRETGGIVEEFIEAGEVHSPSAPVRIEPTGQVSLVSTHDQILGGPTGQTYLGCRFPAAKSYRNEIGRLGLRVGEVLRDHGVVSRFGVDFLALRKPDGTWRFPAIEINLRMGGTTGPFLALQFLTSGSVAGTSSTWPRTTWRQPATEAC